MSGRRRAKQERRARRKRTQTREQRFDDVRRHALDAARLRACTCTPDVGVRWAPVPIVELRHDTHCALLRSHEGNGSVPVDVLLMPARDERRSA